MLRIDRIALREIRLPLQEPFRISSGLVSERRICLLELTSSEGITGWSTGPTCSPCGPSIATTASAAA